MSHLQIRRSCLLLAQKWLVCRGKGGLIRSTSQSDQSEKTFLSCHSGCTTPETESVHRQLLPGLLLWQPSQSVKEAGVTCPCFVWQLSHFGVAWWKQRQGQQQNMFHLSSSGLGNSKHTANPNYHAPMVCIVHRPLCILGLELTKQNMPLFLSLWCIGSHEFKVSPWTHDVTVW
jgi:hypothetical protein